MTPELWRIPDICRHYGIARRTFYQWRDDPAFPEPVPGYAQPRYRSAAVKAWRLTRVSTRNGRDGAIVGRYRQSHNAALVAREVGLDPTTVRRILRRKGEIA